MLSKVIVSGREKICVRDEVNTRYGFIFNNFACVVAVCEQK